MILLVDDNEAVISTLTSMVRTTGFEVEAVTSPLRALARASQGKDIKLLIADISMPEMDGFELYRQMRIHRKPVTMDELSHRITTILGAET